VLTASVAHEVDKPLAFILHGLEDLAADMEELSASVDACPVRAAAEEAPETPCSSIEVGDFVERAKELVKDTVRIRTLIVELDSMTHLNRERRPTRIEAIIDKALEMAADVIRPRARIVRGYGETPEISIAEARICQLFTSLLTNAAQSIPEGRLEENVIEVRTRRSGAELIVEVQDTGCGIPDEARERVFDLFYSTKPEGIGSGLGLSVALDIVHEYGGEIELDSRVGRGSCFRVRLPVDSERPSRRTPPRLPERVQLPRRSRILLVDDDEMVAKALARILRRQYEVLVAGGGIEAMNVLQRDEAFDLILSDIAMPGVSGIDLHGWLGERCPDLAERMVFVTGGTYTPEAMRFQREVGNEFVEKALGPAELQEAVSQALRRFEADGITADEPAG
jgi:CheY-like chemotaxis protein